MTNLLTNAVKKYKNYCIIQKKTFLHNILLAIK